MEGEAAGASAQKAADRSELNVFWLWSPSMFSSRVEAEESGACLSDLFVVGEQEVGADVGFATGDPES